jgi:hypothetical protein
MAKVVFGLGIAISIALLAIAITAGPPSSSVEARAASVTNHACSMREVALDQGYGVSRKVVREVCPIAE